MLTKQNFKKIGQDYIDKTGSYVTDIRLGDSSHYNPRKDEVVLEERLFAVNPVLGLFVYFHELVHAYQEDRAIISIWFTYFIRFMRKNLRRSFAYSTLLAILLRDIQYMDMFVLTLVSLASVSVLFFEYEASRKAIDEIKETFRLTSKEAENYLWLALGTYINNCIMNIAIVIYFMRILGEENFFVFITIFALPLVVSRIIRHQMKKIESQTLQLTPLPE